MIGSLHGKISVKSPPYLMLDVNGVGYELEAPMTTFYNLPDIGDSVLLYTHMVVREDAQALYGFFAEPDRALFRSLIKVSGVGPKLGLTILSGLSAQEFFSCVHQSDANALVRLPGIGKKTAERMIIEMRDRLPDNLSVATTATSMTNVTSREANAAQEAVSALISLGYKPQDASRMVRSVGDQESSEEVIRLALKSAC